MLHDLVSNLGTFQGKFLKKHNHRDLACSYQFGCAIIMCWRLIIMFKFNMQTKTTINYIKLMVLTRKHGGTFQLRSVSIQDWC